MTTINATITEVYTNGFAQTVYVLENGDRILVNYSQTQLQIEKSEA